MIVRPAAAEDIPLVLPMVARICAFHQGLDAAKYSFRDHPQEMYRNWLISRTLDSRSVFLVADATIGDEPRKLAGFLVGTVEKEIPIYLLKGFGFIHDLWIEEDYRNEGVARQIATLAIERFRGIGVRAANPPGRAFQQPARPRIVHGMRVSGKHGGDAA